MKKKKTKKKKFAREALDTFQNVTVVCVWYLLEGVANKDIKRNLILSRKEMYSPYVLKISCPAQRWDAATICSTHARTHVNMNHKSCIR